MLFFLTSIAVVLIATGGAAALYGADTIRSESGATIAIAGVSVVCAGFLLLGLVQVCVEVRRLRRAMEAQADAPRTAAPLPPVPVLAGDKPAGQTAAQGVETVPGGRVEPTLAEAAPVREGPPAAGPANADRPRTAAERDLDADLEARAEAAVDSDLLAAGEDKPPQEAEPAPVEPAKERGDPVATYTSGGNTYFMYGDGTIEADTPKGRFRFSTMAELRHYAETGEGGILLKTAGEPDGPPEKPASRIETITI